MDDTVMETLQLNMHDVEFYHTNIKLNERYIYLIASDKGWYRVFRQGQRSWEAVGIVPTNNPSYQKDEGVSIAGNASNLLDRVSKDVEIYGMYKLNSEAQYRMALMSIAGTGKIDSKFKVEFIKDEEL